MRTAIYIAAAAAVFCLAPVPSAHSRSIGIHNTPAPRPGTGVKLVLMPAKSTVKLGQTAWLLLKNTGTKTWRYYFRGGSNGCVLPIFRISVTAPNGKHYSTFYDGPGRMCTMAIVPPRWIVLKPGQQMRFALRTNQYLYAFRPFRRGATRFTMTPGTYRVHLRGGLISLSTRVTVVK